MLKQIGTIFLLTVGLASCVRCLDHIGSVNQSDVLACQTQKDGLNRTGESWSIILNQLKKIVHEINDRSIVDLTLSCPNELTIDVVQASISNKNRTICPGDKSLMPDDCEETLLSSLIAIEHCQGLVNCSLSIRRDFKQICVLASQKYIAVSYNCIEAVSPLEEQSKKRSKRYIRLNYHLRPKRRYYESEGYGEGNDDVLMNHRYL